jgi:hypothetical protein
MIDRGVAGIVLMVLGAICTCYFGVFKPAEVGEQMLVYALSFALIAGGVWLWMRKGHR